MYKVCYSGDAYLGDRLRVGMKDTLLCLSFDPKESALFERSAGGSSNGRTAAFEAVNRGSNPCPPAKVGSIEAT